MFESLSKNIQNLSSLSLSEERKEVLQSLVDYVQSKVNNNQEVRLNFICTHNSRRSHLSQVWSQVMAFHFNIKNIVCYSGGTEATALFPKVAQTLESQGFKIQKLSQDNNPVYAIKFAKNEPSIIGFSKAFDDTFNPESDFLAIMTCSQADEGCPFIAGAEKRIPVRYDDPKVFDGTDLQSEKYLERSIQIASEMKYVFSQIQTNSN
jgi:arsenate reductase